MSDFIETPKAPSSTATGYVLISHEALERLRVAASILAKFVAENAISGPDEDGELLVWNANVMVNETQAAYLRAAGSVPDGEAKP